jgi:hypothetical protein
VGVVKKSTVKKKPVAKRKPQARRAKSAVANVLVLRTVSAGLTSYGGFKWPESGHVVCPDWKPTKECGNGFHGLINGAGNHGLLSSDPSAKWQVVETAADSVIDLGGKGKFPECDIVYCGTKEQAIKLICERAPAGTPVVFGTATAGYGGTATAGYGGTATAGERGTATAGYGGTATAGDRGTATAGDRGTATAGECGSISIEWYDRERSRYRRCVGEIDGETLRPGVKYRVEGGKFVEAK